MRVRSIVCSLLLSCVLAPAIRAQVASLPPDSLAIGRRASAHLLAGRIDSLMALFAAPASTDTVLRNRLRGASEQIRQRGGTEVGVLEERWMWRNGQRQYVREANFSLAEEPLVIRFALSGEGRLVGWGVNPRSQTPPADPTPPGSRGAQDAAAQPGGGVAAAATMADFRRFQWILGRWRGAGAGALAGTAEFHEEFSLLDDSTMVMRAFERPPFVTATDSTRFEFRNGRIQAVPARGTARMVTRFAADTVVWSNGVRYVRLSGDSWRALLPPRGTSPAEMSYEMRRMSAGR